VEWVTSAAGIRIPKILYGTAWKKADTERLVASAVGQGFRGIDTACQPKHYDEPGVGAGVATALGGNLARADLYLQTKFTGVSGQDPKRIPYDAQAPIPQQVAQSFEVSLRNLRTDYIDCLVLHSPLPSAKQTHEAWAAMEALVDSGKVGQLGISNCYQLLQLEALYDGARVKPAVIQNRFYADTQYDRNIRAYCRRRHILYQSFWTLTANPKVLASPAITALTEQYQRTAPQILFRYLTQIDAVPLTGTSSQPHMQQDLAIFEFQLTAAEIAQLSTLF
jgi:diketogulonate reductase-like aldo/keto reductase